jgi:hypothetical protein
MGPNTELADMTDSNGEVTFTVNVDPAEVYFGVEVSKQGYVTKEMSFTGSSATVTIMEETQTYTITVGPFKDNDGKVVYGAEVTLSHGDMEWVGATGPSGYARFTVNFDPSGQSFDVEVSHPRLEDDTSFSFTGSESGLQELDMTMTPEVEETTDNTALYAGIGVIILIIIIIAVVMMMQRGGRPGPGEELEEEELFEEEEFEEEFGEEEEFEEEEFGEEEELFEEEEEELFEEEEFEEEEELFEEEEELFEEEEE